MKPSFFGDSYDIVKRALVSWLQPLGEWAVHPMLTETAPPDFPARFSALIGAPLVSTDVLEASTDRKSYFNSCRGFEHLLLDPNTGMKLRSSPKERSPDHLFDSDLCFLASLRPRALTIVFDQSLSRGRVRLELEAKLARLRESGIHAFAYVSHACFIFAAKEPETSQRAYALLCGGGLLPDCRFLRGGLDSPTSCSLEMARDSRPT